MILESDIGITQNRIYTQGMQPGDFVSHPSFGIGRVISASGDKADVRFEGREESSTLQASALTLLQGVPANKLWRLRDHGQALAANIERLRSTSPGIVDAFETLLTDLAPIIPEGHWEVVPDKNAPASATLYVRLKTPTGSTRGAFIGIGEKARRPAFLVVAIVEIERLPKGHESAFKLHPKGYHGKDYLRAELSEGDLSRLPELATALRGLISSYPD